LPPQAVRGVHTAAVKGDFTPKEALDRMLDGTGLVVVQDEKTGAPRRAERPRPKRRKGGADDQRPPDKPKQD